MVIGEFGERIGTRGVLAIGLALLCLVAALFWAKPASAVTYETGYNPDGLPTEAGCFWTGPFTRKNPKTNVAVPGTEITYWGAKFRTPPGSTLTLRGAFPHARYSSLNSYDNLGASQTSLPDRDITPDPGSINPGLPGANRTATNRSYTVEVRGEAPPATPAGNTLYAAPVADGYQTIIYRVYIPDRGRDLAGGTGVPVPSLRLAGGQVLEGSDLCNQMNSIHYFASTTMDPQTYQTLVNWPGRDPLTNPAVNPMEFSRYWNLQNVVARYKTPAEQREAWRLFPNYAGTQYDNRDARYMTSGFSFRFGKVIVLKGKLPTTPRTLNGQKKMTTGQLVAWDMCIIQALVTTKTWNCVFDEQLPLRGGKKREYTIVISQRANRPKNARTRCGVWWMAPDPDGDGGGRTDVGQLLTRNVLPAENYRRSSWGVPTPFPADAIRTMGPYYPKGTYTTKKSFEKRGCPKK